jgi:hypothetical protein
MTAPGTPDGNPKLRRQIDLIGSNDYIDTG